MSIAVNYNRIGFCYLIGKQPIDWQMTFKAATTIKNAENKITQWIDFYRPDVVITEDPRTLRRKGERARMLLDVAKRIADGSDVQHIEMPRVQPHRNLYDRIDELCERYPQLKAARPRRRKYYQKEPPYVTIFDAASMADEMNS
jgi:hypothetical protein